MKSILPKTNSSLVVLVAALALSVSCGGSQGSGGSQATAGGGAGERPETLRLVVSDIQGLEELQRTFGGFQEELSGVLGMEVELVPVPNISAATAALESERTDLVLAGPAEYVAMRAKAGAVPVLGVSLPGYYSLIAARKDSGIDSLEDLEGREMLIGVPGGTSTHLGPCKMLRDEASIDCQSDVELVLIAQYETAQQAFLEGEASAIGMPNNRYQELLGTNPEAVEEFEIVGKGPTLPPDVFMARPELSDEFVDEIRQKFLENEESLLEPMFEGTYYEQYPDAGFTSVEDSDYDYMREAYRTIGVEDFSEALEE